MSHELLHDISLTRTWYAVQTFNRREIAVSEYLRGKGLMPFIPMLYKEHTDLDGKPRRTLMPAVHNLLFFRKALADEEVQAIMSSCPYPARVLVNQDTGRYYEIPDAEMLEFRAVCDPDYEGTLYATREFAEARPGQQVRVTRGTFKGLTGKLVRYKNRSYVIVTLATIGVFVHIPKWYCERVDESV